MSEPDKFAPDWQPVSPFEGQWTQQQLRDKLRQSVPYYCPVCGEVLSRELFEKHIQKMHIADPAKLAELERRIAALEAENEQLKAGK